MTISLYCVVGILSEIFPSSLISDVCTGVEVFIGSKVQCLFGNLPLVRERGEKEWSANLKNEAHTTIDPRNASTPVDALYLCPAWDFRQGSQLLMCKRPRQRLRSSSLSS